MVSASPKVSSTDIIATFSGARRAMSSRCTATPSTKKSGTVTGSARNGSTPNTVCAV